MNLKNPKLLAFGAGTLAGAVAMNSTAQKAVALLPAETVAAGKADWVGGVTAIAGLVSLVGAYYAPEHPKIVGAIWGISGLLGVVSQGAGVGTVASTLVGGSLFFGSPELKRAATLGLYGLGGVGIGQSIAVTRAIQTRKAQLQPAPSAPPIAPSNPDPRVTT